MYRDKEILAIIPARSGSKGLKDKNIKNLHGKPLIAYTIEAAINSNIFTDVVVSTDSELYGEVSEKHGAQVPFIRPKELATDHSSSIDVIINTIDELNKKNKIYDYFMLLQPTSPLRDSTDLINAVNLFFEKKAKTVVSVCETEHSPLLMNTLDSSLEMNNFLTSKNNKRRQELPDYYRINGAIYLSNTKHFLQHKDFYNGRSFAYIMDQMKSIDIDTEIDFEIAKVLMKFIKGK